eukprot:COSAG01_NODE_5074_length_4506_cov_3.388700_3_plen_75_part_00
MWRQVVRGRRGCWSQVRCSGGGGGPAATLLLLLLLLPPCPCSCPCRRRPHAATSPGGCSAGYGTGRALILFPPL